MIGPLAHPAGDENGAALTLTWRRVIGSGFALARDADRRSAFQAVRTIAPLAMRALRPIRTVGEVAAAFSQQLAGGPAVAGHLRKTAARGSARLRRAVPAGGRRSLPVGPFRGSAFDVLRHDFSTAGFRRGKKPIRFSSPLIEPVHISRDRPSSPERGNKHR